MANPRRDGNHTGQRISGWRRVSITVGAISKLQYTRQYTSSSEIDKVQSTLADHLISHASSTDLALPILSPTAHTTCRHQCTGMIKRCSDCSHTSQHISGWRRVPISVGAIAKLQGFARVQYTNSSDISKPQKNTGHLISHAGSTYLAELIRSPTAHSTCRH